MTVTKSVTKPSKQRKRLYQAPAHVRYKLFSAVVSNQLKSKHKVKSLPVRSGDTVRILRGDHKGTEGKITRMDRKKVKIYIEGLTTEKVDGTTIFPPIHPSKVMITRLNLDDKWRKKILNRKKEAKKGKEEVEKEPQKETLEKKGEKIGSIKKEKSLRKKQKGRKKKTSRATLKGKGKEVKEKKKKIKKEERPAVKRKRVRRKTSNETKGEA